MIGQAVGSYVILERIGSGGMGEVYLAEHRHLDRRAAIKFLLPGLSRDAELVSRFFNEARALSRIDHPGIVQVLDCDVLGDQAYIVMEMLEGESMATVLARAGGAPGEPLAAAAVAGQIASALAVAHDKGIVHRDLKPDNLFFALGRQVPFGVKILDFGIAKLATDNFGGVSQTRPGSLLGTPAYMAPEQGRGIAGIDHRVDVYALGCILFEMIAGRKVFTMEVPGDLLVAHIQEPAPRLASCAPRVPTLLDDLVAAMLAKSPDDRPQTMGVVITVLEKVLGVPVASFGNKIPPTSALIPGVPATGLRRTAILAAEPPAGSTLPPAVPMESGVISGGTQILPPATAVIGPPGNPPSTSDSTFRRTASEIILPPPQRSMKPVLASVAGLAAAGIALAVTLTVRSSNKPALAKPVLLPPHSAQVLVPPAPAPPPVLVPPPPAPEPIAKPDAVEVTEVAPATAPKHEPRTKKTAAKKTASLSRHPRPGEGAKAETAHDSRAPEKTHPAGGIEKVPANRGYYGVGD